MLDIVSDTLKGLQERKGDLPIDIITPDKIRKVIGRFRPYKAPEEDKVQTKQLKMLPRKAQV